MKQNECQTFLIQIRSDVLLGLIWVKRLSADDTCRVRDYNYNPSKLGSRLDRANRGSTLNLKLTNSGNTPILKLNVDEFS